MGYVIQERRKGSGKCTSPQITSRLVRWEGLLREVDHRVFIEPFGGAAKKRFIWESVQNKIRFFADGRMAAEVVRVLTAVDQLGRERYPTTMFSADEAYAGSCTAKSTIFTANVAAGLMLEQFSRWLRRLPVDADVQLNLLSSELTVVA